MGTPISYPSAICWNWMASDFKYSPLYQKNLQSLGSYTEGIAFVSVLSSLMFYRKFILNLIENHSKLFVKNFKKGNRKSYLFKLIFKVITDYDSIQCHAYLYTASLENQTVLNLQYETLYL